MILQITFEPNVIFTIFGKNTNNQKMKGLFSLFFQKHSSEPHPEATVKKQSQNTSAPGYATYSGTKESIAMGHKVFHKDYQGAIDDGLRALKTTPNDPMVHINLMNAYYRGRDICPEYFEKSTEHAKLAMLNGHHTGLAEYRLAVNLEKMKFYHQTLQLYDLILNTQGFHFSPHGMGNDIDFNLRRTKVLAKLSKASDKETDRLFTEEEMVRMIQGIQDADEKERKEQLAFQKKQKALYDKIMKM